MNPKYEPCISKIERVMAILADQGKTKSYKLKFFKSRYITEFLRQGPKIWHVIRTFIGFKITFSNIGSQSTPLLIPQTLGKIGLTSGATDVKSQEIGLKTIQ